MEDLKPKKKPAQPSKEKTPVEAKSEPEENDFPCQAEMASDQEGCCSPYEGD